MTETLTLVLTGGVLGALLGWSVGFARRRHTAWPLFTALLALLGLMGLLTYSPEATTSITALDSVAALTRGLALTVVTIASALGGWKAADNAH